MLTAKSISYNKLKTLLDKDLKGFLLLKILVYKFKWNTNNTNYQSKNK